MGIYIHDIVYIDKAPPQVCPPHPLQSYVGGQQEIIQKLRFESGTIEIITLTGTGIVIKAASRNSFLKFSDEFNEFLKECYVVHEQHGDYDMKRVVTLNGQVVQNDYFETDHDAPWPVFPECEGVDENSSSFLADVWKCQAESFL